MATGTSILGAGSSFDFLDPFAIVEQEEFQTGNPNPRPRVFGVSLRSSHPSSSAAMSAPPPGIPEASRISTQTWQNDLLELFHNAKDRFPDVVWELHPDRDPQATEEVWGHKGVHSVLLSTRLTLSSDRVRACTALVPGALLFLSPSAHRVPDPVLALALPSPRAVLRIAQPHPRLCPQLSLAVPVPLLVPLPVHEPGRHPPSSPANIPGPLLERAGIPLHGKGPRRGVRIPL